MMFVSDPAKRVGRGPMRPVAAVALLIVLMGGRSLGLPAPRLEIDAPPALAAARARLEAFDPMPLVGVARLVGLNESGPAIRVVLATESSSWARQVSRWTAGFAFADTETVVLFPARAPAYPHDTLEDVLRHEVAHVLIARAAGGRPVPPWFHEGLAMAAERTWGLEDRTRLVLELTLGPRVGLGELGRLFAGDRRAQARAYALAGAFVRDLLHRHGATAPGEILARVKRGMPFDAGFADATGATLAEAEAAFWQDQRLWTTWVPLLTSTTAVWMVVTLLALFAIRAMRKKSAALRRRWAEQDGDWPDSQGRA